MGVARPIKRRLEATPGLVVHVAANPDEMMSFLDEFEVEAVLVRTPLPGSDGFAIAREVRDRWPKSTVVMTGPSDNETVVAALEAGVSAYAVDYDDDLNIIVGMVQQAAQRW